MTKKELLLLAIYRMSDRDQVTLLNAIIEDATDDATFDGYYDITDALSRVVDA